MFYLVMLLSALGRTSFPFLRVPLTFPRTFSMTRYEFIRLLTQYHPKLLGTARMMMIQRELDAKFGRDNACAALPAADGTDRRAGDWHRRSHRVRLITAFPTKHLFFSAFSV